MKSYQEKRETGWSESDETRFSPAYVYNQVKLSDYNGDAFHEKAFELVQDKGVTSMCDMPYDESLQGCSTQRTPAQHAAAFPSASRAFGGWRPRIWRT